MISPRASGAVPGQFLLPAVLIGWRFGVRASLITLVLSHTAPFAVQLASASLMEFASTAFFLRTVVAVDWHSRSKSFPLLLIAAVLLNIGTTWRKNPSWRSVSCRGRTANHCFGHRTCVNTLCEFGARTKLYSGSSHERCDAAMDRRNIAAAHKSGSIIENLTVCFRRVHKSNAGSNNVAHVFETTSLFRTAKIRYGCAGERLRYKQAYNHSVRANFPRTSCIEQANTKAIGVSANSLTKINQIPIL